MNAHDRLEQQLRDHVRARAAGAPAHLRARLGLQPVLAAAVVVITVAVIAVAVLARGSGGSGGSAKHAADHGSPAATGIGPKPPNPGRPSKLVDQAVISSALIQVDGRAGCDPFANERHGFTEGTPDPEMLAAVPALTQQQDQRTLPRGVFSRVLLPRLGRIFIRYVRLARTVDRVAYYLVPVAHAGVPRESVSVANRCYALEVRTLDAALKHVPAVDRTATRRFEVASFAFTRYELETAPEHQGLMLLSRQGGGGDSSPAELERTGLLVWIGSAVGPTQITGVVPGGVASVELTMEIPGQPRNEGLTPTLRAGVVNDVFVLRVPKAFRRDTVTTMIWRSASGARIKTVNERGTGL